ncbi:MAG: hypothetical protein N2050_10520 [Flavobacteriales bacterium]|nr:hypothetical protein [Flavobacteriales bacterium]
MRTYLLKVLSTLLILVGLASYFTWPAFEGKTLRQYDILQHKGMSKEIDDYRAQGETIYWTNSMFSGMPAYMVSTFYNDGPIHWLNTFLRTMLPYSTSLVLLLMLGFFIMLLALNVEPFLAAAGAVAYGFSTYFIVVIGAGHNAKAHAMALLPPLFAGMLMVFRGRPFSGAALFGLFLALELKANHPQMTYYFGFILAALGISEMARLFREKDFRTLWRGLGLLVSVSVLSVGAHYAYLKTTQEYGRYTIRGGSELSDDPQNRTTGLDRDYVTQWSYGISETLTLLIPDFKGGESTQLSNYKNALRQVPATLRESVGSLNAYWGDQPFTAGPVYAGAGIVALFLFALFTYSGPAKVPLLLVLVLTMALSWGHHLKVLPLGLVLFGVGQVVFWGFLKRQPHLSESQKIKYLRINVIVSAGLLLLTLFGPLSQGPDFPLTHWFLDYFPAYNKFRAVASILVVAEFLIPMMAILGLAPFVKNPEKFHEKASVGGIQLRQSWLQLFLMLAGALMVLLLIFAVAPGVLTDFFASGEKEELMQQLQNYGLGAAQVQDFLDHVAGARSYLLRQDALRSLFFVALTGVAVWLTARFRLKPVLSGLLFLGLITFDLVPVNFRYINKESWVDKKKYEKEAIPFTRADAVISEDKEPYFRVANMAVSTFNDATTSYRHKSIGGYHGAKLRRYQDVIEKMLMPELEKIRRILQSQPSLARVDSVLQASKGLNMLNVKYLIYSPEAPPLLNRHAMGNAWFVPQARSASNADEEMALALRLDPRVETVLAHETSARTGASGPDSSARIRLTHYHPEKLEYEVTSQQGGIVVFSEVFYPLEWHAFIDDQETTIFRAHYILRAIQVPAGSHKVALEFRSRLPERLKVSTAFSYVLTVLILLGFGHSIWTSLRRKKSP